MRTFSGETFGISSDSLSGDDMFLCRRRTEFSVSFFGVANRQTRMDAARAALDALMGGDRNLAREEKANYSRKFTEPHICKNYLCGFCPYDLFVNTKSALGTSCVFKVLTVARYL